MGSRAPGVIGTGWSDGRPFAMGLARTDGWDPAGSLALDALGLDGLSAVVAADGGAFVLGKSGHLDRAVLLRLQDGAPVHAASWWPAPSRCRTSTCPPSSPT